MTHTTKKGLGNLDRLGIGICIARPALNIGIAACDVVKLTDSIIVGIDVNP